MTTAKPRSAYEHRDVPARAVLYIVLTLFGTIVLSAALVAGFFVVLGHFDYRVPTIPSAADRSPPPPPRLQVNEGTDRAALEAAARGRLQAYGWIDRPSGRARIPIERAMQIEVERGWPDKADEKGSSR